MSYPARFVSGEPSVFSVGGFQLMVTLVGGGLEPEVPEPEDPEPEEPEPVDPEPDDPEVDVPVPEDPVPGDPELVEPAGAPAAEVP